MTKKDTISLSLKELKELGIIKKKKRKIKKKKKRKVIYIDAKTGKQIKTSGHEVGGPKSSSDHMIGFGGNAFSNSNNLAIDAIHRANEKARQGEIQGDEKLRQEIKKKEEEATLAEIERLNRKIKSASYPSVPVNQSFFNPNDNNGVGAIATGSAITHQAKHNMLIQDQQLPPRFRKPLILNQPHPLTQPVKRTIYKPEDIAERLKTLKPEFFENVNQEFNEKQKKIISKQY
jgi:hypothetical protein